MDPFARLAHTILRTDGADRWRSTSGRGARHKAREKVRSRRLARRRLARLLG